MAPMADIRNTLGAILAGGMTSVALSGAVAVQGFLYFRLYPRDIVSIKALVALIWTLDAVHSMLISVAIWKYFVLSYGDPTQIDVIYTEIALTVAVTAALTFVVHAFFSVRVFRLSKANWLIAMPIILFGTARLGSAIATTVKMRELHFYSKFVEEISWVFTLGLALSTVTDISIAMAMCYFLQTSRTGYKKMDHAIDIMLVYSFNNGAVTCIGTIAAMVCWITMHNNNLIFLGIHFCIAKLYALSLMVTLNTRLSIRKRVESTGVDGDYQLPVRFPTSFSGRNTRSMAAHFSPSGRNNGGAAIRTQISVNVEKTVHFDGEDESVISPENPEESERVSPLSKLSIDRSGFR